MELEVEKYACKQCDFITTLKRNLRRHKFSLHKDSKYKCDQCDYKGKQLCDLKRHRKSMHEGIKYYCEECEYKATTTSSSKNTQGVHTLWFQISLQSM